MEREGGRHACLSPSRALYFHAPITQADISQHVDLARDLCKALDVFQQFQSNKMTVVC